MMARFQNGVGESYLYSGRYEEALRMWEASGLSEAGLARYYALTGQREKALGCSNTALWAQGDAEPIFQWNIALVI